MSRLRLDKPLAFFDLETTGKYPDRDRIVDITIVTLFPDGTRSEFTSLVHPTIPIPPGATAIHGITDAMVADAPTFKYLARSIAGQLQPCDLAGYNLTRFDLRLLCAEFRRAAQPFLMDSRKVIDVLAIYRKLEPRDLTAAVRFFCGETHDGAHRAAADVEATIAVLTAQLTRYPDLPATVAELHDYCKDPTWIDDGGRLVWDQGVACIGFGKHAGRPLASLAADPAGRDYLRWILSSDFPTDTKRIITDALAGTFPKPPVVEEASHAVVN